MKVLITGSSGLVGSQVASDLAASDDTVVGYDLVAGQDILDSITLRGAARGCDAIVHSAALLGLPGQDDDKIMATNLQGTWNVLSAAREAGTGRVVFLSSVDALGVFKGERAPDYLPLDDDHPCNPATPYGISKLLAESMCRLFTESSGISVICLRPPGVWTGETYDWIQSERAKRAEFEWAPFWEYGAFIDVRDLSRACICALTCKVERFACLLVSSADISTSGRTSRELADFVMPDVEWRGGSEFEAEPFRSLVAIENARSTLGWTPQYLWRSYVEKNA
ncbi:NAD-dependent epimerase/dehydratase family protein [Candidatus Eisenbacteria bacterium]|uniref:NAD-dependent epimerase/dehydratase family protein n=1 Tax=Eiseniibacteriota bacterium TaxID=2212470 RepID=A0ABV6YMU5_UNCEI